MTDTSVRDQYIDQFIKDTLEIPCVNIRLTQLGAPNPKMHEAAGTLQLGKSFGLRCVLKVQKKMSLDEAVAQLRQMSSNDVGKLVPVHRYFRLEAVTGAGVQWTCPAVTVALKSGLDAYEVHFGSSHVENISHAADDAFAATLTYIDELRLPNNRFVLDDARGSAGMDGSVGRLANLDLTYQRRFQDESVARGELTVIALNEEAPPRHFDTRVLETVQFCSALFAWPVCTELAHGKLRSILFTKHRPVHAGIATTPQQGHNAEQDFYKLATAYYEHACKEGDVEALSGITRKVASLFDMGGASIGTMALNLAVAVEALAQSGPFKKLTKASKQHKAVAAATVNTVLAMPELDDLAKQFSVANKGPDHRSLKERVEALLKGLSSGGRTVDVLKLLEAAGAVTESEISAWNKLRHPVAHGSWEPKEDLMQDHFDDLYKMLTLVYRLVFAHIGYEGRFSTRSDVGWPTATFKGKEVLAAMKLA